MKSLRDIKTDVAALACRIGASDQDLPTYGTSEDFARPHIEVEHVLPKPGMTRLEDQSLARIPAAE